jgi:hypothetical protein
LGALNGRTGYIEGRAFRTLRSYNHHNNSIMAGFINSDRIFPPDFGA